MAIKDTFIKAKIYNMLVKINKMLRKELIAMFEEDQAIIREGQYLTDPREKRENTQQYVATADAHAKRLKQIISEYGWPDAKKVGRKGEMCAWLIAQHADRDVEFQESSLRLMKDSPSSEKLDQDIALLTDRVLVNRGRKQLYGTQFYKGRDGKLKPRPIRDMKNLDKRRKEVGLGSFDEYKKLVGQPV